MRNGDLKPSTWAKRQSSQTKDCLRILHMLEKATRVNFIDGFTWEKREHFVHRTHQLDVPIFDQVDGDGVFMLLLRSAADFDDDLLSRARGDFGLDSDLICVHNFLQLAREAPPCSVRPCLIPTVRAGTPMHLIAADAPAADPPCRAPQDFLFK